MVAVGVTVSVSVAVGEEVGLEVGEGVIVLVGVALGLKGTQQKLWKSRVLAGFTGVETVHCNSMKGCVMKYTSS